MKLLPENIWEVRGEGKRELWWWLPIMKILLLINSACDSIKEAKSVSEFGMFLSRWSWPKLSNCLHWTSSDTKVMWFSIEKYDSVKFSHSIMSDSLRPHEFQYARPPCPSLTLEVCSNSCPSIGDATQISHPPSFPSPPALNPSPHQSLFQWVNSSHEEAKVLEFQL